MNVPFTLSPASLTVIMFDYIAQISPLHTFLYSFLPLITQGLFFQRTIAVTLSWLLAWTLPTPSLCSTTCQHRLPSWHKPELWSTIAQ